MLTISDIEFATIKYLFLFIARNGEPTSKQPWSNINNK